MTTLGPGASMAILDLKHAFRLIPVHPLDWNLLGFSHEGQFYFDTVLAFTLRSSPAFFNQLANCLEWILRYHGTFDSILHYMNDVIFAGPCASSVSQTAVNLFVHQCEFLGVPLAQEKAKVQL